MHTSTAVSRGVRTAGKHRRGAFGVAEGQAEQLRAWGACQGVLVQGGTGLGSTCTPWAGFYFVIHMTLTAR